MAMLAALAAVLMAAFWVSTSKPPNGSSAEDSAPLTISEPLNTPRLASLSPPIASPVEETDHDCDAPLGPPAEVQPSPEDLLSIAMAESLPAPEHGDPGDVAPCDLPGPPTPSDDEGEDAPVSGAGIPVKQVSTHIEEPAESNRGRFRIQDENGQPVVARLHGKWGDKSVLILPDGQLGIPNRLVPTEEPFRPLTAGELLPRLQQGPLGEFEVTQTAHYVLFYQSSRSFAESSGRLLEDLYGRLLDAFRKNGIAVHDAEFPLVAVIYRTERDFRKKHKVEPIVQAFYEIYSNRITFFETSDQDVGAPEIADLRKPQTVAHEGTHQILQNIGVHPRLSSWPNWLVEGLAEYCATPATSRKGSKPVWDGLGMINGLHMATIRELNDPLSVKLDREESTLRSPIREPGKSLVESMIRKPRLTPTEYSLAWAMTHYLGFKRQEEFVRFLKKMSELAPLRPMTADDHVAAFEDAFGSDLPKLDRTIDAYIRKLDTQKRFDRMPYYSVLYQQVVPNGLVRRVRVSQSPQVIWQWVQEVTAPQGERPTWQAVPYDTRGRALQAARDWMSGAG